jgi:predicted SAM-dependent methyltransferase
MIKRSFNFVLRKLGCIKSENKSSEDRRSQMSVSDDILRLQQNFSKYKKVKLHVGCGPRILKGWINIDLSYEPYHNYMQYYTDKFYPESIRGDQSDFYATDVTKNPLPFPDNSVDVIFHEDFLEHLNQRDQILFLSETCRILKNGGIHRINTPNLITSMRDHSNFSRGYDGVYTDEWNKHGHLNVLTPNLLKEMALMVGYSKVVFTGRDQSTSKLIPLEYRPDPKTRGEYGNIFADLIK